MATEITTKMRLERLMAAKAELEAQISKNGQILAAVNKYQFWQGDMYQGAAYMHLTSWKSRALMRRLIYYHKP